MPVKKNASNGPGCSAAGSLGHCRVLIPVPATVTFAPDRKETEKLYCVVERDLVSRSLREPSILDMMVQLPQERLVLRLPPPTPIDTDRVPIQVHLHPHQPMQPVRINLEAPTQHLHRPLRTGPP